MDLENKIFELLKNALNGYSTSEKWTGEKWIDGKKIYKKTVNCGALPNPAGAKNTPHAVNNIDKVVSIDAVAINSNGTTLTLPRATNVNTSNLDITADRTNVTITTYNSAHSAYTGYVTLYYTCTDR